MIEEEFLLEIKFADIIKVFRETFTYLNQDVEQHSYEVAYITYHISKYVEYDREKRRDLVMAAYFHDLGACKIDSDKRVCEFEDEDIVEHSIYSYLFIKYFTPIPHLAATALYHHNLNWESKFGDKVKKSKEAEIIYLADELAQYRMKREVIDRGKVLRHLEKLKGHINSDYIEAVKKADLEEDFINRWCTEGYKNEVFDYISTQDYSVQDLKKYIEVLGYSVDVKSQNTISHSIGVYTCTKELCNLLNLDSYTCNMCCLAGFLHDIGKVGVPGHILKKAGQLTEEEYEVMKEHVVYTRIILSQLNNEQICNMASNHHEKLNGTGYPLGISILSREERIIAVADLFSALTERRYYREGFSKEKVIDILMGCCEKGEVDEELITLAIEHYEQIIDRMEKNISDYKERIRNLRNEYIELINCTMAK